MYFNSNEFIFLLLPVSIILYSLIRRFGGSRASLIWIILVSLGFYSMFSMQNLAFLSVSIGINYLLSRFIAACKRHTRTAKAIFVAGIVFNIVYLCFFKYALSVFKTMCIHVTIPIEPSVFSVLFPVGLSFLTFQQILYLTGVYRCTITDSDVILYLAYITFFPKLVSGPITNYESIIPGLTGNGDGSSKYSDDIAMGVYLFCIGLFKKLISDQFAPFVDAGFNHHEAIPMLEAWIASLSYSFQIYFDFSGYTDMAIGIALFFRVKLPQNFNSPYRSFNISEFWRRWHITLSHFLRDYVYIPMGGNRRGEVRTYLNILITFMICGLWHGTGFTFFIWGCIHGLASVVQRMFSHLKVRLPRPAAWFITFNTVNIAWVFFRARSVSEAIGVLRGMAGFNGFVSHNGIFSAAGSSLAGILSWLNNTEIAIIFLAAVTVGMIIVKRNSNQIMIDFKPTVANCIIAILLIIVSVLSIDTFSNFIYYNF